MAAGGSPRPIRRIRMCRLCELAGGSSYAAKMDAMAREDGALIEKTNAMAERFPSVKSSLLTTIKFPPALHMPLFEARNSYTLINNYFQQLLLEGNRMAAIFSHGSTRSIFFSGEYMLMLSKSVGQDAGSRFFSHYLLFHFSKDEYSCKWEGNNMLLSADCRKKARNLLTGETEEKRISFNFQHQSVEGRILQKEEAMRSSHIRKIYGAKAPMQSVFASADLEGYVVTVPHFSPHPYLLQAGQELGHPSNRHFQEHVAGYLREHLPGG